MNVSLFYILLEQCYDGYCMSGGVCRISGNIRYCDCPGTHTGARCETPITAVTTTTTTTAVQGKVFHLNFERI